MRIKNVRFHSDFNHIKSHGEVYEKFMEWVGTAGILIRTFLLRLPERKRTLP
jgi:hypothetical protein